MLREQGHQMVEVQIPNLEELIKTFVQEYIPEDKMRIFQEACKGEKLMPQYQRLLLAKKLPGWLRSSLGWVLKRLQPRMGFMVESSRPLSTY